MVEIFYTETYTTTKPLNANASSTKVVTNESEDELEEEFDNDIEKLLEDIQKFAVESEEYEIAAIIRDALNKEK